MYHRAVDLGSADSALALSEIHFHGALGCAVNKDEVLTWKSKAGELAERPYPVYVELLKPLSLFYWVYSTLVPYTLTHTAMRKDEVTHNATSTKSSL